MRRRKYQLPPNVDPVWSKGRLYLFYRIGKGPRIPLPPDPKSAEFRAAYAAAMASYGQPQPTILRKDAPGTIGALIASYLKSAAFIELRETTKVGYMSRLNRIREDHGKRTVSGLTRERIIAMLQPFAGKPGAALDTLKKLRILITHAINIGWLHYDPSLKIKRPKTKEVRAWTSAWMVAFERRWPIGTKKRTAYELMLEVGTARVDVHKITWTQIDFDAKTITYTRSKTGVTVEVEISDRLMVALLATPREHVTVLNTAFGKPFTIDGFSGFMRDAIRAAELPLECRPHGLRKTLGRRLADAEVSTHDIMAALGHTTLAQAENYTREANRRRGGRRATNKLNDHNANKTPQTATESLGKFQKTDGETK